MKFKAFNPPKTPIRLVARAVQEEQKERFSAGGIALPESSQLKHNIVVQITSPSQYAGERVLISSSTNGQDGWYFPETSSILASVED